MTDAYKPYVVVVGAGAMGGLFGGLLKEGGLDVTLIDIKQDHVDAINRDGLKIVGYGGDRFIPIRATTDPADAGVADVVIVLTKGMDTVTAVTGAKGVFGDDTVAISFQNGLGNEEAIAGVIGAGRVFGGVSAQGATVVGPGVVRNFSDLPSYIGEMAGGLSERAERIAHIEPSLLAAYSRILSHGSTELPTLEELFAVAGKADLPDFRRFQSALILRVDRAIQEAQSPGAALMLKSVSLATWTGFPGRYDEWDSSQQRLWRERRPEWAELCCEIAKHACAAGDVPAIWRLWRARWADAAHDSDEETCWLDLAECQELIREQRFEVLKHCAQLDPATFVALVPRYAPGVDEAADWYEKQNVVAARSMDFVREESRAISELDCTDEERSTVAVGLFAAAVHLHAPPSETAQALATHWPWIRDGCSPDLIARLVSRSPLALLYLSGADEIGEIGGEETRRQMLSTLVTDAASVRGMDKGQQDFVTKLLTQLQADTQQATSARSSPEACETLASFLAQAEHLRLGSLGNIQSWIGGAATRWLCKRRWRDLLDQLLSGTGGEGYSASHVQMLSQAVGGRVKGLEELVVAWLLYGDDGQAVAPHGLASWIAAAAEADEDQGRYAELCDYCVEAESYRGLGLLNEISRTAVGPQIVAGMCRTGELVRWLLTTPPDDRIAPSRTLGQVVIDHLCRDPSACRPEQIRHLAAWLGADCFDEVFYGEPARALQVLADWGWPDELTEYEAVLFAKAGPMAEFPVRDFLCRWLASESRKQVLGVLPLCRILRRHISSRAAGRAAFHPLVLWARTERPDMVGRIEAALGF